MYDYQKSEHSFYVGFFFFWFPLGFGLIFNIELCISLLGLVKKQNSTE